MKQRARLMQNGDEIIMGTSTKENNSDGASELKLHRIKGQDHFIEAQVQEGDTLQAIALRFYCSISELKRINQIHKDNEIFAKRTIKIPVTPYSVLTEIIPSPQSEPKPSSSQALASNALLSHNGLIQNSPQKEDSDFAIDCNAVVLNSTLAPSVIPYTDTEQVETVSEDTQLLPNKMRESVDTVVVKHLTSQGADYGIKWYHLLCILLVLCVVTPLVYVMFVLEKHEHSDIPPLQAT